MTTKEFIQKVIEMRDAQREYFRTRSHLYLEKAKSLEKEVDKFTEDYVKVLNDKQLKLF